MDIKITFADPIKISTGGKLDKLRITFADTSFFFDIVG